MYPSFGSPVQQSSLSFVHLSVVLKPSVTVNILKLLLLIIKKLKIAIYVFVVDL